MNVIMMFPALLLVIFAGAPVAFSLMLVALGFGWMQFGDALVHQFVSKVDDIGTNYVLGAVPLFIFMGAMLEKTGIAEKLFDAIYLWTRRLPGGLALGALAMCTIFAAASGVVGATETMVGMLALPAMLKRGYDKALISGTICGGGSLGTIIPPSVTVVVLAPVAGLPVGDLFAGIMLPGLLMAVLFGLYIVVSCIVNPEAAPRDLTPDNRSLGEKLRITAEALVPPVVLIAVVLGTILFGLATPTEAAACGAMGSLLLAVLYRRITVDALMYAAKQTLTITAMILLIVMAGSMFSGVFFSAGGMIAIQETLDSFGLHGWSVVAVVLFITFLLGFALDLISIILIVMPVAMPLIKMYGIDPLLFCVMLLVTLQTSYLTPPMAPSIFYLRAIAPPEITLNHMYRGVIPFIVMQVLTLLLIVLFPSFATWLPAQLYGAN